VSLVAPSALLMQLASGSGPTQPAPARHSRLGATVPGTMLYQLYQAQTDFLAPARFGAKLWLTFAAEQSFGRNLPGPRLIAAAADMLANTVVTHKRRPFALEAVQVQNRHVHVRETIVAGTPFCNLLRFEKDLATPQPKVLIVAPMSGHFATLLRPTVQTMLPDCDVHITDWQNARDVPLAAGDFGLDDYAAHIIGFLEAMGPGAHLVAICQPAVAALVATSVMAAAKNPARPRSLTLMAGPIDTRANPTRVNTLAQHQSIAEYERKVIATVPRRYAGAGRRVYPGFMQLAAFLAMNADRHINAHAAQFRRLFAADLEGAAAHRKFYDEYFAVSDLPARFYLETVDQVFQRHTLPLGQMRFRGETVDPAAIRHTSLLVVEGERDDICGIGQTMAALDLCRNIPASRKTYHLQTGAGHYGVFSGRAWTNQIFPKLRQMIQQAA
jgi:poly(3-hydroxybutyrate) depolymerase